MAPKELEIQTHRVILCLFQEDDSVDDKGMIEPDGAGDEDAFDPVLIADKLRELADDYDERVIQPLIDNVRQAAADQMVAVLGDCVDSLCKGWVAQTAEVAPEKQILKATVMLAQYVKTRCPDLASVIPNAMTDLVYTRLGSWVSQQGGWDEVVSQ